MFVGSDLTQCSATPFDGAQVTLVNGKLAQVVALSDNTTQLTVSRGPGPVVSLTYGNAARFDVLSAATLLAQADVSTPIALTTLGNAPATPIHVNYIPSLRKVLVNGWKRRDTMPCYGGPGAGGRRSASLSFLLDPARDLQGPAVAVRELDEAAEYAFGVPRSPPAMQDGQVIDGDSIYCAGHTTLPDGRVFFVGGAR